MDGIKNNVTVATQQPKKYNKVLKHAANATMTATGVGVGALGAIELVKLNSKAALMADTLARTQTKGLKTFGSKLYNFVSKIGNKLFPEGGKWHTVVESFANRCGGKASKQILNGYKGNAVVLLSGVMTAGLALLLGAFNAGKISRDC